MNEFLQLIDEEIAEYEAYIVSIREKLDRAILGNGTEDERDAYAGGIRDAKCRILALKKLRDKL